MIKTRNAYTSIIYGLRPNRLVDLKDLRNKDFVDRWKKLGQKKYWFDKYSKRLMASYLTKVKLCAILKCAKNLIKRG